MSDGDPPGTTLDIRSRRASIDRLSADLSGLRHGLQKSCLYILALGSLVALLGSSACGHLGIGVGSDGGISLGGEGSGGFSTGGKSQVSAGGQGSGGASTSGGSSSGGSEPAAAGADSGGTGGRPEPGTCEPTDDLCQRLAASLSHRYSFDDAGTELFDSVGAGTGHVVAEEAIADGQLRLSGSDEYVKLPAGMISPLPAVCFEIWFTWHGGDPWQRLFDFGYSTSLDQVKPDSYLYVTVQSSDITYLQDELTAGISHGGGQDYEQFLDTDTVLYPWEPTHLVLVVDDANDKMTVYRNGQWLASQSLSIRLPEIADSYAFLGRSLFAEDPYFRGTIEEFRIYDSVLSSEMVARSFELGPDAALALP